MAPLSTPVIARVTLSRVAGSEARRTIHPVFWVSLAMVVIAGVILTARSAHDERSESRVARIAPEQPTAAPPSLAAASHLVSIEMYSAAWCAACSRAKAWMQGQGIAYHEVDVDRRAGALAQLQTLNPRSSLPTFDIDGQVIVGFEETRLQNAIDDAARRVVRSED